MVSTVHSYIMEMTSHFKERWQVTLSEERWWAVTVHSYIMEMTSHFKKRWWAVTVHTAISGEMTSLVMEVTRKRWWAVTVHTISWRWQVISWSNSPQWQVTLRRDGECNSPQLYHGGTSHFKKRWWAVTVHSYIMEMTWNSHLKKRWWAVTVHSYIMEMTSHFKKRWRTVTVHSYIMEMTSHVKKRWWV